MKLQCVFIVLIICMTAQLSAGTNAPGSGAQFVTVSRLDGKYFFIRPDGSPFLSLGVNTIKPFDDSAPLGSAGYNGLKNGRSIDSWAAETAVFLSNLGFNTAGSWSYSGIERRFYYALQLKLGGSRRLIDIFEPIYINVLKKWLGNECAEHAGDAFLLGYFIENDLPWYGDLPWYTGHTSMLFDQYLELDGGAPGKKRLVFFLRNKYKTIENLNIAWNKSYKSFEELSEVKKADIPKKALEEVRSGFLSVIAEHFYGLVSSLFRKSDPGHLLFSDRYANSVPEEVLRAAGKYCDVIAVNYYKPYAGIDRRFLDALAYYSGRPVLITEFAIRSMENSSGLKNLKGVNIIVKTQKERAERFRTYAGMFLSLPYLVGYHWFQFFDEPSSGRFFDGEDSNYGIVDHNGIPYEELCSAMRGLNTNAVPMHKNSREIFPKSAVRLDGRIVVNNTGRRMIDPSFMDPSAGVRIISSFTGSQKVQSINSMKQEKNNLIAGYDTGNGWGLAVSLQPDRPEYFNTGTINAAGFKGIEIRLALDKAVRFSVNLNEAGSDAPDRETYHGINGSDGESFSSEEMTGTGSSADYKFDFDSFTQRVLWGSQTGDKIMAIQALKNIEIFLPGGQGKGEMKIESIRFY